MYEIEGITSLIQSGNLEVKPVEEADLSGYTRLNVSKRELADFSQALGEVPGLKAAASTGGWILSFPRGGSESQLLGLHQGGYSTVLSGADGKFIGTASIHKAVNDMLGPVALFSALAVVTGQYFMSQIRTDLKLLNEKADKILGFLYGDKRADIMAQIYFVQSASSNYGFLAQSPTQTSAQLIGMQEARKTAMRNILFYISDLKGLANADQLKDGKYYDSSCRKADKICQSLELSIQLLLQSSWMEVLFTDGCSQGYIDSLKNECDWVLGEAEKTSAEILNRLVGAGAFFKKDNPLDFLKADCTKSTSIVKKRLDNSGFAGMKKQAQKNWSKLSELVCRPQYILTADGIYVRK